MNIPVSYDKIASLYALAKNKTKATDAGKKAIDAAIKSSNVSEKQIIEFKEKLNDYYNL